MDFSLIPVPRGSTFFAANWRFEGGQNFPNMPGELVKKGKAKFVLNTLLKFSFLPWLE